MIIAAIIENGSENEILLCQKDNAYGQSTWSLPHIFSDNISDDATNDLIKDCRNRYDVGIDIDTSEFYQKNEDVIAFRAHLCSCTYASETLTKGYQWIKTEVLSKLDLDKNLQSVFKLLISDYMYLYSIRKMAVEIINDSSKKFDDYYTVEIQEAKEYINVFIKYPEKVCCPFGFRIDFTCDKEDVQYIPSIFAVRSFANGDKTDIYILFSNCMAIIQKIFGNENIYLDYLSLFDECEINGVSLIFMNKLKKIAKNEIDKFTDDLEKVFVGFTVNLVVFGSYFGSFIMELDVNAYTQKYLDYLCSDTQTCNFQARKEMQYYSDFEQGITLLCLRNNEYKKDLFANIGWEIVDGVDGKILCQLSSEDGYRSFNYISNDTWDSVCKVIEDMDIGTHTLLCQSNALYLLEDKNIWIFYGDFNEYWVSEEKKKLAARQSREQILFNFNRDFKWIYPINYSRFEELMADLCEQEEFVQTVRLLGKSNCPDGGRDLLIWKARRTGETSFGSRLTIGQCKAYSRSVNKKDVADIRDTLDNYDAVGFHLFASSSVTAPLIDNLIKLRKNYESDWWTEREIFQKLRQQPDIADRYSDIVSVVEKCTNTKG